MPDDPKIRKFLQLLKDLAEKGKLKWDKTPDPAIFRTMLGTRTIRVAMIRPSFTVEPTYYFAIVESDGSVLEEFSCPPANPGRESWEAGAAAQIYTLARRAVLDVDTSLDALLQEMEKRRNT